MENEALGWTAVKNTAGRLGVHFERNEVLLTLALASAAFDPDRGAALPAFAYLYVRHAVAEQWRHRYGCPGHRPERGSGEASYLYPPLLFGDATPEVTPQAERGNAADLDAVAAAFASLPREHKDLLSGWLGLDGPQVSLRSMADGLGVTGECVSLRLEKILTRLRKILGVTGVVRPLRPFPRFRCRRDLSPAARQREYRHRKALPAESNCPPDDPGL